MMINRMLNMEPEQCWGGFFLLLNDLIGTELLKFKIQLEINSN